MKRIVGLVVALVAIVYVRSTIPDNIHPWQLLWMIWVVSTCLVSGCLGYVIYEVRHLK